MANTDRAFGFRPVRFLEGAPFNGQGEVYGFSASQANNAYKGDVVQFDATNRTTALTDSAYAGVPFIKPVVAGVTTGQIRGVILGFVPEPYFNHSVSATVGLMYRVLSTARFAWVVHSLNVVFEVQEDGNDYVSASDNSIGKTADVAYTAGSTTTGVSGAEWDSSDAQASSARPFKALRYTQRVDNFNFSAADAASFAKLDVVIANSDLAQADVGE